MCTALFSLPAISDQKVGLVLAWSRREDFFASTDRSQMHFTDPFPCSHASIKVNSYRCTPSETLLCICFK